MPMIFLLSKRLLIFDGGWEDVLISLVLNLYSFCPGDSYILPIDTHIHYLCNYTRLFLSDFSLFTLDKIRLKKLENPIIIFEPTFAYTRWALMHRFLYVCMSVT